MPEMPIDPEFNRFLDGIKEVPEEGIDIDMDMEDAEVEELPDGSAVVQMEGFKGPSEDEDFYANLAETLNLYDIEKIASRYVDLIENDKESREKRDKQQEEGLKRTGMGDDAPGGSESVRETGAPSQSASTASWPGTGAPPVTLKKARTSTCHGPLAPSASGVVG